MAAENMRLQQKLDKKKQTTRDLRAVQTKVHLRIADALADQAAGFHQVTAVAAHAIGMRRRQDLSEQRTVTRRVQILDQPMQAGSGSKLRRVTPADLQLDLQEY